MFARAGPDLIWPHLLTLGRLLSIDPWRNRWSVNKCQLQVGHRQICSFVAANGGCDSPAEGTPGSTSLRLGRVNGL